MQGLRFPHPFLIVGGVKGGGFGLRCEMLSECSVPCLVVR